LIVSPVPHILRWTMLSRAPDDALRGRLSGYLVPLLVRETAVSRKTPL